MTKTSAVETPTMTFFQPAGSNPMNANVHQRVVKVLADVLNLKEIDISANASLRNELQASSLDQMTIFIALEDEFQRSIPQEEVTEIRTVGDIVDFISKKLDEPVRK